MKLYHLTNERGFNAHISAPNRDKAAEIFLAFLVLNGVRLGEFSLRRVQLSEFGEADAKAVRFVLSLEIDGVMTFDAINGPIVMPPFDRRMREDEW